MAKLNRESKIRERRLNKQAKKQARKRATADHLDSADRALNPASTEAAQPGAGQASLQPTVHPVEIE